MKIIFAREPGYNTVSTPADAVVREMEQLGHKLYICENIDFLPIDKCDFVFSAYEATVILGEAISEKLKIPHFAHIEVIPPWRYFEDDDLEGHGISKDDPEADPAHFQKTKLFYKSAIRSYKRAAVKTTSNPCRLEYMSTAFGKIDDIHIRYPSIDVKILEKAKKVYSPKKGFNNILTITRLVPLKRLDLLINTMNKVKTSCTWNIFGEGDMAAKIVNTMNNKKVNLKLNSSVWGWAKAYEILKANLFIFSTGAMPPMEASLLGTSAIIMESQGSKYLPDFKNFQKFNYNESLPIFKYEEYDKMATKIDEELNNPTILKEYDTVNKFMLGNTGITPSSVNAKNIIKLMEEVI